MEWKNRKQLRCKRQRLFGGDGPCVNRSESFFRNVEATLMGLTTEDVVPVWVLSLTSHKDSLTGHFLSLRFTVCTVLGEVVPPWKAGVR